MSPGGLHTLNGSAFFDSRRGSPSSVLRRCQHVRVAAFILALGVLLFCRNRGSAKNVSFDPILGTALSFPTGRLAGWPVP